MEKRKREREWKKKRRSDGEDKERGTQSAAEHSVIGPRLLFNVQSPTMFLLPSFLLFHALFSSAIVSHTIVSFFLLAFFLVSIVFLFFFLSRSFPFPCLSLFFLSRSQDFTSRNISYCVWLWMAHGRSHLPSDVSILALLRWQCILFHFDVYRTSIDAPFISVCTPSC